VPDDSIVRPQSPAAVSENAVFHVMGYPAGTPDGAPFKGEVRGTDARGWHHVEADRAFGRTLEPGFSGAPAIEQRGRLLGIVDLVNPLERRGVLIPVEALMRAWPPLAEPYRGLHAFREEDAAYFFGRETIVNRLWQSFERHPITLLIGPSGSGKSSLINAGLLPKLRVQEGWRVIRIRPGNRPVEELVRGLVAFFRPTADALEREDEVEKQRKALLANPARLVDYANSFQKTDGCGICLIVDQFEETFTLARVESNDEHNALLAALANIGRQSEKQAIKAVLGMRSDFQTLLQADDAATGIIKAVDGDPTILLRHLDSSERQRVIQGPLDRLEVSLEDGLLGRLIDDANKPDALPLLEFVLAALWEQLRIDNQGRYLTNAAYDDMEGLSGAVAKYADQVIAGLEIDLNQVKHLFIELVRVADTAEQDARRPRSKGYLDTIDQTLWPLAQELVGKRLLVTTDEPGVDIVHEALFRRWGRLAKWINEERDFLRWRQRLEERMRDWQSSRKDPSQLLKGPVLAEAAIRFDAHVKRLGNSQIEFFTESQKEAAAERVKLECNELWERLWLNWKHNAVEPHEVQAVIALTTASKEVRLRFLTSAVEIEPRARRFIHEPAVVLRATLGLDIALAEALARWLKDELHRRDVSIEEPRRAALEMGRSILPLAPDLPALLLPLAIGAIAETTAPDRLRAYGEMIRAFADKVDSAIARAAANAIVERAVSALAETTDPDRLRAYGEMIWAVADKVDSAAANAIVERAVSALAETTDPDRLEAYSEMIRAVADKVDSATARAAANAIVERAVSALAETTDPDRLWAYAQMIVSLQTRLSREGWILIATEFLKYPFSALGKATSILESGIGTASGLPEGTDRNLWDLVPQLSQHNPWLPLSRSWQGAGTVIAEFRHLSDHGLPLPHPPETST
jgi:energy-coupling factor transporter ATP-binding protein EcfA2